VKPLASGRLLTELEDSVLTVTLNRPDKLNAVTIEMLDGLRETFETADADDGVRCVVVTGRGRAFCAGADLSEGASRFDYAGGGEGPGEHRDKGGTVTLAAHACRKPVIGALNGTAAGFGASFTLGFDVRLASETARIGFVYARRGTVTEGVSSWFLPRLVGMGRALEWMSTGRLVNAKEGLAAGLFHSVHPADGLLPAARALAREIVENTLSRLGRRHQEDAVARAGVRFPHGVALSGITADGRARSLGGRPRRGRGLPGEAAASFSRQCERGLPGPAQQAAVASTARAGTGTPPTSSRTL
jgi:enoyl-CoA hydratase/carnithine racemase